MHNEEWASIKKKKKTSSRDLFKTAKTNGSPRMLTGGCLRDSRTKKWHHLPPSFSPFFPSSLPPFLPLFLSLSFFLPPSGENQHPLLPLLDLPLCSRGCPGAPHCWRAGAAQRLQASEQLYLLRRSGNQKQIAMFSEAENHRQCSPATCLLVPSFYTLWLDFSPREACSNTWPCDHILWWLPNPTPH